MATNNITGKRYIDHWIEAGFECGTRIETKQNLSAAHDDPRRDTAPS